MSLSVQVYRSFGISTVRCEGNLCVGASTASLERVVKELTSGIVVLDLERVVLVDAHGLGALVGLHQWAEEKRVRLYIANPRAHLQQLFRMTKLDFLFEPELAQLAG
jgi:anti-anti-sigma factor